MIFHVSSCVGQTGCGASGILNISWNVLINIQADIKILSGWCMALHTTQGHTPVNNFVLF